tara:strand:+ start:11344 stop:12351 length:1008 start_codon:yes stop_codon:yes gene_type:complete
MLQHWADDIIIPAWNNFSVASTEAVLAADTFSLKLDASSLETLRFKYQVAYRSWQKVSLFEIGPGEQRNIRLRCNTYPTDTSEIKINVNQLHLGNEPNLLLPSTFTQQGFPALDYLLYSKGSVADQLNYLSTQPGAVTYMKFLFSSINNLANEVYTEWSTDYRTTFLEGNGSSASASVNKMANDFIFHYEKELRAGKVGIPAGIFSSNTLPHSIESLFNPGFSKELFQTSFDAHVAFFNGTSYDGLSDGPSFSKYLDHLGATENGQPLSDAVNQQFEASQTALNGVTESFKATVETDNFTMLGLYDELQRNTIRIKTDVMQILNVKIDYVDADGD